MGDSALANPPYALQVDEVTVNETNLKGNNKFQLEGFLSFSRNRKS